MVNVSEADPHLQPLQPDELAAFNVKIALYPVAPLLSAAQALATLYQAIAKEGTAQSVTKLRWDELTDLLGQPALLDMESRYSS